VWAKLNDPNVLKLCIPGCETLAVVGENEVEAVATNKIGPVKARFKGKVRLSELDPPRSYKLFGEGDGGIAGFAKGASPSSSTNMAMALVSRTMWRRRSAASSQLGQRLINGAAKKLADDFFVRFAEAVKQA
jgi:uncharacterized protein